MKLQRIALLALAAGLVLTPLDLVAQTNAQAPAAASSTQVAKLKRLLMGELDNLIPGKLEDNAALQTELKQAVEFFVEGNRAETTKILKAQAAKVPGFPPVELLQAGLSYGAGYAESGFQILENAAVSTPDYPGVYLSLIHI